MSKRIELASNQIVYSSEEFCSLGVLETSPVSFRGGLEVVAEMQQKCCL